MFWAEIKKIGCFAYSSSAEPEKNLDVFGEAEKKYGCFRRSQKKYGCFRRSRKKYGHQITYFGPFWTYKSLFWGSKTVFFAPAARNFTVLKWFTIQKSRFCRWKTHFFRLYFFLVILFLDCKMFLPVIQVHPFKEERSQRRSIRGQLLMHGNPSSTETTPFTTGHWRISPEYSIDNDWTFSSGIECHNRIVLLINYQKMETEMSVIKWAPTELLWLSYFVWYDMKHFEDTKMT